jgi:hypothetical protein
MPVGPGSGRRWPCLHLLGSAGRQSLAAAINCPRLLIEGFAVRLSSAASAMLSRAVAAVLARHRDDGVALCGAGEGRFFAHPEARLYS